MNWKSLFDLIELCENGSLVCLAIGQTWKIQEDRLPNARLDLTCFIEWKGKWHILKRQTLASSIHWLSESETEATYVFVEAENNTGIVVECNTSQASDYQELEDGSM